ncbi:MAG: M23 family metallopeptidase [Thermodesulfovibrionales bacterium]|nr:M23 family metallopeptidase [Thermodesulfovibrionales bacterium]
MYKVKKLLKRLFTPITIMVVPHTSRKTLSIKMPSIGIFTAIIMCVIGTVYVFSVAVDAFEYRRMRDTLTFYKGQFLELRSTISALKTAEHEFKKLFSLKSKEDVLENLNTSDSGNIEDIEALKGQIKITIETVGEIRDYLSQQRDLYMATPKGWPVMGRVTSGFGMRVHPITGSEHLHLGLDISTTPNTPVRVTADGVVSFAGWGNANGNIVVVEHGFGYSTFYAHNKKNIVSVGQKIKRGDVIAKVGSTGNATGPHLHYEIWKNGHALNPAGSIASKEFKTGQM